MNKLFIAALAATAATFATPAMAATNDTGTVTINGTVAGRCLFTTNSGTITIPELALTGTGTTAGKLDTSTLVTSANNRTLVGWCNKTASTMTVTAKPLLGSTTAPNTSFDDRIDISAQAVANTQTATDGSAGEVVGSYVAGTPAATVGIFSGNVVVSITGATTPNSGILTAGTYLGSIDVTLAPAV